MEFYRKENITNLDDLKDYQFDNIKYGVIVDIIDKEGRILLQKRGVKSRDENGKYEQVGGKFDLEDKNFQIAILREMKEEMGEDINIELSPALGIYHVEKGTTNWLFVIFRGYYKSGTPQIMEQEKCEGQDKITGCGFVMISRV